VTTRTVIFDQIIAKSLSRVEQFVVMGSGFDTKWYGDISKSGVALFELDQAKTQKLKIEYLKKCQIYTSNVHYAEVDISKEHWYDKPEQTGYESNKKTIFLWEGVTLYLSEQDVRNTIREIKEHAAAGSVLAID